MGTMLHFRTIRPRSLWDVGVLEVARWVTLAPSGLALDTYVEAVNLTM
jgi:hypothetical protein